MPGYLGDSSTPEATLRASSIDWYGLSVLIIRIGHIKFARDLQQNLFHLSMVFAYS